MPYGFIRNGITMKLQGKFPRQTLGRGDYEIISKS